MDVVSECPLRVASILWQPREGAFILTIVCKATYALLPDKPVLADVQDVPNEGDEYWDDDEQRSLSAATDLAPFKRGADVIVVGHAYPPRGHLGGPFLARVVLGEALDKAIEVHGDRGWTPDGRLLEEPLTSRVMLRWERAAGGPGTWNPVGVPANAPSDHRRIRRVPNLQPPGLVLRSPADQIPPVGFGPLAPTWPDRRVMLHRHAGSWDPRSWNERPLPNDIDASFFNAAPLDQRVDQIRGDERLVLEGLHPHYPRLLTTLTTLRPRATARRSGAPPMELQFRCDTLCIDTDRGVYSLVWRGSLPLAHPREEGRVVVSIEGEPAKRPVEPVKRASDPEVTSTFLVDLPTMSGATAKPTLPFVKSPQPAAAPSFQSEVTAAIMLPTAVTENEFTGPVRIDHLAIFARAPLPFVKEPAGGAPEPVSEPTTERPPPRRSVPETEPPAPARSSITEPPAPPPAIPPPDPLPIFEPAPPPMQAPPSLPAPPPMPQIGGFALRAAPPPPVEPPVIESVPAPPEAPSEPPTVESVAPPPPPSSEEEPAVDPATVPVERYAAIAAEIAERRDPRAQVLKAHGLTERSWTAIERHWTDAINEESSRGDHTLRAASDSAYVAAVEGFRGRVTPEEYARLVAALERGQANAALDDAKIQRPALLPILRSWTKRIAGDPKLAGETITALAAVRTKK